MKGIEVKQVVVTELRRMGTGIAPSPIRIIKEVYDFDGNLIAGNDPCEFSVESILEFLVCHYKDVAEDEHKRNVASYFLSEDDE